MRSHPPFISEDERVEARRLESQLCNLNCPVQSLLPGIYIDSGAILASHKENLA